MKRLAAILVATCMAAVVSATPPPDSLRTSFSPCRIIAPAVLVGAGAAGLGTWWHREINIPVRDYAAKLRGASHFHADDYIQYLPAIAAAGLAFLPENKERRWNIVLTAAAAGVLETAVVQGIKYSVRAERPDGGKHSFPSGHTAIAFAGAELVRAEYGGWPGAAAYAVAVATGLLRIYNERHWCNDVLAGAGIGILCSRIAMWAVPVNIIPSLTFDPREGAVPVLALSYPF